MKAGIGSRASGLHRSKTWRAPTRRAFVAMVAAAAAAVTLRTKKKERVAQPELPRWIGHV